MSTEAEVKTQAIGYLQVDYSQLGFVDDAAFQTWMDAIVADTVSYLAAAVGDTWDLTTDAHFRASWYSTVSAIYCKFAHEALTQGGVFGTLTLGNFSHVGSTGRFNATQLQDLCDRWQNKALAQLKLTGTKGLIKTYTPRDEDRPFVL